MNKNHFNERSSGNTTGMIKQLIKAAFETFPIDREKKNRMLITLQNTIKRGAKK